jgi:uncharacterized lipoprotein YajG
MPGNRKPRRKKFERAESHFLLSNLLTFFKNLSKMKKILLLTLTTMAIVVVALSSCDRVRNTRFLTNKDSVAVYNMVHETMEPSFTSADEFTKYALAESDYLEFATIVRGLEPITISSIAFNAIKENKMVDYAGFVREYEKNKNLYDVFDAETKRSSKHVDKPLTIEKFNALEKSDTINVK